MQIAFAKILLSRWFLLIWLILNAIVFCTYGIDKWKAKHDRWRIPERTLIFGAVLGVIGAGLGMMVFHHKVRKPKFSVGVPLIFVVELIAVVLILRGGI